MKKNLHHIAKKLFSIVSVHNTTDVLKSIALSMSSLPYKHRKNVLLILKNMLMEHEHSIEVTVLTAHELSAEQRLHIESTIKNTYKVEQVYLKEEIQDYLIGGVKIKVKDEVHDLTLNHKINTLRQHLIHS